jgi:hypothetical protein
MSLVKNGSNPTRLQIKKKARSLCKYQDFRASKGWLDKFYKRFNIPNNGVLIMDEEIFDIS